MPREDLFVLMVHKDFPDREPAKVLKSTFEKLWKEKGWQVVDPESKKATASSESTTPSPTSPSNTPGGSKDN